MNIPPDDLVRRHPIIDTGRLIGTFVAERKRADLDQDPMLVFALTRALEVIGEAASKISKPTRALFDDVAWHALVGMRNRLIHAYFDVDGDMVRNPAILEVPRLVDSIKAGVPKPS